MTGRSSSGYARNHFHVRFDLHHTLGFHVRVDSGLGLLEGLPG
jgi:hypothetical protein